MPGSGKLKDRITFQRRALDANGDRLGAWEADFTVAAQIDWLRGSQPVMEQRLQGIRPVVLTVRDETRTRALVTPWRAVNARNTQHVFEITSVTPARDAGFLDLLATAQEERQADGHGGT